MADQLKPPSAPLTPKKKSRFAFLRKPRFWIPTVIIVVGGGWFLFGRGGNKGPTYETAAAVRGDITQTVEVTGEIKPDARLNLAFKSGGTLQAVNVKVGQAVKAGDVLAELEDRDLRFAAQRAHAALAIAQANLSARLAGATKEDIAIAQAQVDQAQASYDKSLNDLDQTKQSVQDEFRVAQLALDAAQANLANSGASADQNVVTAYSALKSSLQGSTGPMRTALIDGDAFIGVDNTSANDSYESIIGIYASDALNRAKQDYPIAKAAETAAETAIKNFSATPSNDDLLAAADLAADALNKIQTYLDDVQKTAAGTITNSSLTDTALASIKATMSADRSAVSAQLTAVTASADAARTSGLSSKTSKDTLQNAYDTAKANFDIAQNNLTSKVQAAATAVEIQKAALGSAQAALDAKKAPPRDVDVAALRAQVLDAQTAAQQADEKLSDVQITAPVDGIVTDIIPNLGEQVTANVTAVNMVTQSKFTVDALVPEADIAKVSPGQPVQTTLDAYGDTVKFTGTVLAEDPDQTKVSDAIYYKTTMSIDTGDKDVKPGMTANVTIDTGDRSNVIIVPTRAIRENNGVYTVRVLENGVPREITVTIGLRGDDGKAEALSGVTEGMQIITAETTP
ncbi:MAG TPA: efflux RND transporter periplasmic adaptor subunit [Verrucomicrobiae bacterium]|nr:efflux RND transporter periplasmic adaptor subunit [Verrucomicrobiae bacterium]